MEKTQSRIIKEYKFQLEDLQIHPDEVLEMARMEVGMDGYDLFLLKEIIRLKDIQSIKGSTATIDKVTWRRDGFRLNDTDFTTGRMIAYDLKDMEKGILFICTAGEEVSVRSRELMKEGQLLEGYLVDVLGSIMVEKAIQKIHDKIEQVYSFHKWTCSNRYSPGYCDWPVAEQKKLFSFFPTGNSGITIGDTCLMHPVKSVSGIIAVGQEVKFNEYRCETCKSSSCIYRKVKSA